MSNSIVPGRRVVVTGMGAITPVGNTLDAYWANLIGGVCGIAPLERDDKEDYEIKVAAVVRDFDPLQYIDRKEARRMDRYCQFAVAASMQAIEDSDLDIASYGAKRWARSSAAVSADWKPLRPNIKNFIWAADQAAFRRFSSP